jgi:Flp pilus assembly protein TadB
MKTVPIRLSEWAYRRMLIAYPARFRREYAPDMVQLFHDSLRDAVKQHGTGGMGGLWLRTLFDLFTSVLRERLATLFRRENEMTDIVTFNRQFGSVTKIINVMLRSGYSVVQIMEALAERAPEPTASVFKRAVEQIRGGKNSAQALEDLKGSVQSESLHKVIDIMLRQRQQGGNLADMLDGLDQSFKAKAGTDKQADDLLQAIVQEVGAV